jgi:23S rRNA (cytosine1962-C5)-methyltransferase
MVQNIFSEWEDYQLIDSGGFEKLEQFGDYILIRPEKSATWKKSLSDNEWKNLAHAKYTEKTLNKGTWEKYKIMPDSWNITFRINNKVLSFILKLREFKHIGIFPEQKSNWNYIYNSIIKSDLKNAKILNLFAYTGIASLAAKSAGAEVTHIDSLKQIISWAKENMVLSKLDNIRYLIDDSVKFVKKEINRNNFYNGIILDPPTFGIGTKGERWIIERDLESLLSFVNQIIDKNKFFIILNLYSSGFDNKIVPGILKSCMPFLKRIDINEIFLIDNFGKNIPAGIVFRADNVN